MPASIRHTYFMKHNKADNAKIFNKNGLFVINYAAFIYFALWPTQELIEYLMPKVMSVTKLDIAVVPFVGCCIKVSLAFNIVEFLI